MPVKRHGHSRRPNVRRNQAGSGMKSMGCPVKGKIRSDQTSRESKKSQSPGWSSSFGRLLDPAELSTERSVDSRPILSGTELTQMTMDGTEPMQPLALSTECKTVSWIIDSGATHHMTWQRDILTEVIPTGHPVTFNTAGDHRLQATEKGKVWSDSRTERPCRSMTYTTYHHPGSTCCQPTTWSRMGGKSD